MPSLILLIMAWDLLESYYRKKMGGIVCERYKYLRFGSPWTTFPSETTLPPSTLQCAHNNNVNIFSSFWNIVKDVLWFPSRWHRIVFQCKTSCILVSHESSIDCYQFDVPYCKLSCLSKKLWIRSQFESEQNLVRVLVDWWKWEFAHLGISSTASKRCRDWWPFAFVIFSWVSTLSSSQGGPPGLHFITHCTFVLHSSTLHYNHDGFSFWGKIGEIVILTNWA